MGIYLYEISMTSLNDKAQYDIPITLEEGGPKTPMRFPPRIDPPPSSKKTSGADEADEADEVENVEFEDTAETTEPKPDNTTDTQEEKSIKTANMYTMFVEI